MFCKLIVVLVCLVGAALGESSVCPALVWRSNSDPKPAFYKVSQDEFAQELNPNAKDTMFVVFLDDKLSISDFACSKSSTHQSCFSNLNEERPKTYYANVYNPVEALRQISSIIEWVNVDSNGNLKNDVGCEPGKTVMINLSTSSEALAHAIPRNELLEIHDDIMSKVANKLAEKCKITAVYTCSQSATNVIKNRSRRATNTATSGTVFHSGNDFLIFYTELATKEIVDKKDVITPITITEINLSGKNSTAFTVNMNGGNYKLSFLISLSGGYFKMSNLMLNNESFYVPSELNSPTTFSYSCGNQTFATKKTESSKIIMWNSLQMQAPFNEATPKDFKFGDPWYCVGFFSSGILAGLFVVFILLGIMSVGICWMLDINTMDRFDDPKGKTITINVNE